MPHKQPVTCDNLNHGRARVSIRHCPKCGSVVNDAVPSRRCSEASHTAARRDRCAYCTDCGAQLISA